MNENNNKCFEPDCKKEVCDNPKHYNYICYDKDCDDMHCEKHEHYNVKYLKRNFRINRKQMLRS